MFARLSAARVSRAARILLVRHLAALQRRQAASQTKAPQTKPRRYMNRNGVCFVAQLRSLPLRVNDGYRDSSYFTAIVVGDYLRHHVAAVMA